MSLNQGSASRQDGETSLPCSYFASQVPLFCQSVPLSTRPFIFPLPPSMVLFHTSSHPFLLPFLSGTLRNYQPSPPLQIHFKLHHIAHGKGRLLLFCRWGDGDITGRRCLSKVTAWRRACFGEAGRAGLEVTSWTNSRGLWGKGLPLVVRYLALGDSGKGMVSGGSVRA